MNRDRFNALLEQISGVDVTREAPLAPLTTLKVGGPADWLVEVRDAAGLENVHAAARECHVPITMLGGGSNVLVGDRGIRGAVIRIKSATIEAPSQGRVRAAAGATINALVRWSVGQGLAGLEAWAGTPGTVGGAVYGNAHYGGRNIGDRVVEVDLLAADGMRHVVSARDMEFGYDTSRLKQTGEIVISADFAVSAGVPADLRQIARASLAHRKRTQPLASPSAGCIFQNPDPATETVPEGVPPSAGALIDRVGLRDAREGGARVSPTHANFFINDGGATARDLERLIERARTSVRDRFGVTLRDEIVVLGEF